MFKDGMSFFANLFSSKGNVEDPQTMKEVVANSAAQPYVLRERMKEQELTHGETIIANFSPVRIENAFGKTHIYFCPLETVEIVQKLTPGDGGDIPADVTVEGLHVPGELKSGLYSLKNVKLSSNGTIQVIADSETRVEVYN